MAYEAPAFTSSAEIFACAAGRGLYPWVLASAPESWRRSRMRPIVLRCLDRDAANRPQASRVTDSPVHGRRRTPSPRAATNATDTPTATENLGSIEDPDFTTKPGAPAESQGLGGRFVAAAAVLKT